MTEDDRTGRPILSLTVYVIRDPDGEVGLIVGLGMPHDPPPADVTAEMVCTTLAMALASGQVPDALQDAWQHIRAQRN